MLRLAKRPISLAHDQGDAGWVRVGADAVCGAGGLRGELYRSAPGRADLAWGVDQAWVDQAVPADQRLTDADGAGAPDSAAADSSPLAGVFASGPFAGRGGYNGKGTAELHVDAKGVKQLRFSADFSTSSVPGPVVLLSSRAAIGTSINKSTDLHLGTLKSTSGAQVYNLPAGDGGRRYAWVYCEPFGVEVARAELKDKP